MGRFSFLAPPSFSIQLYVSAKCEGSADHLVTIRNRHE